MALALTVALLLSSCDAWTQARGTIRDPSGKPIPDALITIEVGSDSRKFRSSEDGRYVSSVSQPPWKTAISLTVSKPGYTPYEQKLKGPGIYKDLDVVLKAISKDSNPSQDANTPQGIARALFPDAPEKAQTVSCFRALKPDLSMYAVVQKCGTPDEELGSGVYIFMWHLADGSTVSIGTPYMEKIGDIRWTDASGQTSSLLGTAKHP